MSIATTSNQRLLTQADLVDATPAALTIRWHVSPGALAAVRPDLVRSDHKGDIVLEVRVGLSGDHFHAEVSALSNGRSCVVATIEGVAERGSTGPSTLLHLDAPELVATMRQTSRGFETLYARLPLLTRWGLAGGRYELVP